jgi:hypothetical protein
VIRVLVVISLLIFGAVFYGWIGALGALIICGLLGAALPAPARERISDVSDERGWEKVERARKGSNVDPTRPDDDDHPLMLTNVVRRKR